MISTEKGQCVYGSRSIREEEEEVEGKNALSLSITYLELFRPEWTRERESRKDRESLPYHWAIYFIVQYILCSFYIVSSVAIPIRPQCERARSIVVAIATAATVAAVAAGPSNDSMCILCMPAATLSTFQNPDENLPVISLHLTLLLGLSLSLLLFLLRIRYISKSTSISLLIPLSF